MHEALHPTQNKKITAQEYFVEFGQPEADSSAVDDRPRARCPFCPQLMSTVAARQGGHFAHLPKSDWCPSKEKTAEPYLNLRPAAPDEAAAKLLKAHFRESWRLHYARLAEIAPGLAHTEFIELLVRANRLNIWAYKELRPEHLPYVLTLLADFSPASGRRKTSEDGVRVPARRLWLRFMYSSNVRHADDLWIFPRGETKFFRVSYHAPARARPSGKDILKSTEIERSSGFLTSPVSPIPTFVEEAVERWLAAHLSA